ncbi:arginase family protein [Williamsia sp.]|uniref:arginase family protein n=1 Tax=Williamsia sp. TaxID=1872085 RepID=UPI001A34A32D|nr:arginase family protein [Williamsia sp.]MBJ7289805.1 arginase family protein [Williamsia sp.]
MTNLAVLGVPSSAASYAAGQDQAPRALRAAGLLSALADAGVEAHDAGDATEQVWSPDPSAPHAQNEAQTVESVRETAQRVRDLLATGDRVLVVGGNCTIATGAVAGLAQASGERPGLVYIDRHFDMNTPETTNEGAIDWMGVGHALALPGALESYLDALGDRPLLGPDQLVFYGVDPTQSTRFERDHVAALKLPVTTQADLMADPAESARGVLAALPESPFVVHVDVDVLDFTRAPLSENTSGRNVGPSLAQLEAALSVLVADRRWRVLTVGEINPGRSAGVPDLLTEFCALLARVLASGR